MSDQYGLQEPSRFIHLVSRQSVSSCTDYSWFLIHANISNDDDIDNDDDNVKDDYDTNNDTNYHI